VITSKVLPGLIRIVLPGVNCFALDGRDDGLILIDAGLPGRFRHIQRALKSRGWAVTDLRHILVTHAHADHTGSLAELQAESGANVYMHRSEARFVAEGSVTHRMTPSPGFLSKMLYYGIIARMPSQMPPAQTDQFVTDGDVLPLVGGIQVIGTPGHSEGHVVFLVRELGVLFVGDAAMNLLGLREIPAYENRRQGLMSLARLSRLDFEVACFGHGESINSGAEKAFRRKWGRVSARG